MKVKIKHPKTEGGGSSFGASRIKQALLCPASKQYAQSEWASDAMALGSLVHRYVAEYWYERLSEKQRARHRFWRPLVKDLASISRKGSLRQQALILFDAWAKADRSRLYYEPIWIEREFEWRGLTTKPDHVVRIDDGVAIIDLKTSSKPFAPKRFSMQASLAMAIMRQHYGNRLLGFFHDHVYATKKVVDVSLKKIHVSQRDEERALALGLRALEADDTIAIGMVTGAQCFRCAGQIDCYDEGESDDS